MSSLPNQFANSSRGLRGFDGLARTGQNSPNLDGLADDCLQTARAARRAERRFARSCDCRRAVAQARFSRAFAAYWANAKALVVAMQEAGLLAYVHRDRLFLAAEQAAKAMAELTQNDDGEPLLILSLNRVGQSSSTDSAPSPEG